MTIRIRHLAAGALAAALCAGCSSSAPSKTAAPAAGTKYKPQASKTNPNVVEETDLYYVTRYKKSEMIKVDDQHIRLPFMRIPVRFFKEDDEYYYIRTEKYTQEEVDAAVADQEKAEKARQAEQLQLAREAQAEQTTHKAEFLAVPPTTPSDFDNVSPARARGGVRFEKAGAGLPARGEWRQNIAVADINGDGIPDIVTTPARKTIRGGVHVFLGDGRGGFSDHAYKYVDHDGKPASGSVPYGGVAVADFDLDGRLDIATASHGGTVKVFLHRPDDRFEVVTTGLPTHFSSQAIAAYDVDGDHRPDLVVSGDDTDPDSKSVDKHQVRVFLNRKNGWEYRPDAIEGACYSNRVFSINLEQAKPGADLLTGCKFWGGWGLMWKNDGTGKFSGDVSTLVEQAAYHIAVAPGTYGPDHAVAYADLFIKQDIGLNSSGINVYYKREGRWNKLPVWREKNFGGRLFAIAVGDLDGDGLDDIVFPDSVAHKLRIFYQTKEGRFEEGPAELEPALDSPATDVRLADLNGDGKLDLVVAKSVYSENPDDPGGIEVLLNRGR